MDEDVLRDKIDKNIICRLCLSIESDFVSIDSDLDGTNSRELITKFNLLNLNDGIIVTSICSSCTETLQAIQNFYSTCQKTSKTLLMGMKSGKPVGLEEEQEKDDQVSEEEVTNDDDSDYCQEEKYKEYSDGSMCTSSEEELELEKEEDKDISDDSIVSHPEEESEEEIVMENEKHIETSDFLISSSIKKELEEEEYMDISDDSTVLYPDYENDEEKETEKETKENQDQSLEFLNIDDSVLDEKETNDDDLDQHDEAKQMETDDQDYPISLPLEVQKKEKKIKKHKASENSMSLLPEREQKQKIKRKLIKRVILFCKYCSKQYKLQALLDRHLENAHKKITKNFKTKLTGTKRVKYIGTCNLCGKMFTDSGSYSKHLKIKNCASEKSSCKFACPLCFQTFSTVSNRNTHIQSHNQEVSYVCDYCGRGFNALFYLKKHLKCHIKADNICTICHLKFENLSKYEYHLKSHEANKKYKCDHCVKSFLQQHHLENHLRGHIKYKPFVCEKCGKNFKRECSFKLHLKTHINQEDHVCQTCGKTFVEKSSYSKHLQTHLDLKYLCDFCGKGFKDKSSLSTHEKIHADTYDFKCELCNRFFVQLQQLKYHNYKHHQIGPPVSKAGKPRVKLVPDLYPYVCNVCSRAFKVPSSLASHAAVHLEDRKYVCIDCGNCYKRKDHLNIHINRAHLKKKQFACHICDKSFVQKGDLNLHVTTHQESRNFKCKFCNKTFTFLKAKVSHESLHSGERPYDCGFKNCHESFRTFSSLAKHTLKHDEAVLSHEVTKRKEDLNLPDRFCVEPLRAQNIIIESIETLHMGSFVDTTNTQEIPMVDTQFNAPNQEESIRIIFTE